MLSIIQNHLDDALFFNRYVKNCLGTQLRFTASS